MAVILVNGYAMQINKYQIKEWAIKSFDPGDQTCGTKVSGLACTRPEDHSGDHIAHGFNSEPIAVWAPSYTGGS